MIITRLFPATGETIQTDDPASRDRLLELYSPPSPTWLRINLVASVSGSAAGSDGTSESLSNAVDRRILGVIRELSQIVLIGAESLRTEGYVLPRRVPLAVVTASGNLAGHGFSDVAAARLVVLCPAASVPRVKETLGFDDVTIIEVTDAGGRMRLVDVVGALRTQGYASIVCEGGPGIAAQLLGADLVDEVCLTTSPVINGAPLPVFGATGNTESRLTLAQLLADEQSYLFARWTISARALAVSPATS